MSDGGCKLSFSDSIDAHHIIFGVVGAPIAYRGKFGDMDITNTPRPEFHNRIRDAVASVGIELTRQKLNGEPA